MKRSLKESLKKTPGGEETNIPGDVRGDVNELIGKYSGMSESELMRTLLDETDRQKAEGRFDEAKLTSGMNAILPMLNEEQKRKLYGIIGKLRER